MFWQLLIGSQGLIRKDWCIDFYSSIQCYHQRKRCQPELILVKIIPLEIFFFGHRRVSVQIILKGGGVE